MEGVSHSLLMMGIELSVGQNNHGEVMLETPTDVSCEVFLSRCAQQPAWTIVAN
jgi:hypothetical protein